MLSIIIEKRLKRLFPLASVATILQQLLFNTANKTKYKTDACHMWLFEI
jgi:hypothetical protein